MATIEKPSADRAKALGTVLVVDDDLDTRELLADLMRRDGYTVRPARDGAEALETLTRAPESIAVLLLDLSMPGLDGRKFLERRASDPRLARIPVILISGDKDAHDMATKLGLDGSVGKPINLERLRQALSKLHLKRASA